MNDELYIIILASGIGKRFDTNDLPKQFAVLEGKPVLSYSVETAASLVKKDRIILTYPSGMLSLFEKMNLGVRLVEGGKRRQDSVLNAINSIEQKDGVVLIHDSARPLATKELFKKVYHCTRQNGACVPVLMSTETVKEVKDGVVKKTLNRDNIGFSQTPQGFKVSLLKRVLAVSDFETEYTDEAMLLESHGIKVHIVDGERFNLKLTFKEDLDIIKAFAKILWKKELD